MLIYPAPVFKAPQLQEPVEMVQPTKDKKFLNKFVEEGQDARLNPESIE